MTATEFVNDHTRWRRDRRRWQWTAAVWETPEPQEIDVCIVCRDPVFDDPRHERLDHTAPVRMTVDGDYDGHTHAGCEDDYWRVAKELEEEQRAGVAAAERHVPRTWVDDSGRSFACTPVSRRGSVL